MANVLESDLDARQGKTALLIQKHYEFQRGRFVSEVLPTTGAVSVFSKITPSPMWNHTALVDTDTETSLPDVASESIAWHGKRNHRPVIYVNGSDPLDPGVLGQIGFELFDQEAWMVYNHEADSAKLDSSVQTANTPSQLDDFCRIFKDSFQVQDSLFNDALRSSASDYPQEHYICYEEGRAVSAGTLIWDQDLACIYNLGTPAQQRKKGYAARVMRHILARAHEKGCSTVFLQVEHHSAAEGLYRKLGFNTEFVRTGYRLKEWKRTDLKRTRLSNVFGFRTGNEAPAPVLLKESRPLEAKLIQEIGSFAEERHIEVSTICIGAWGILLSRYLGEEAVCTSVLSYGRSEPEACVISIDARAAAGEWLRHLKPAKPEPQQKPEAAETLLDLSSGQTKNSGTSNYPLRVCYLSEPSPHLEVLYRSDLFSKDFARRMASHFSTALRSIVEGPRDAVGEIEILSSRERNQLLVEWNQPVFHCSSQFIPELFEKQVERNPDAVALCLAEARSSTAREQFTFRQLNRKANKLAHHLQKFGAGPEVAVGVLLDRSLEMIVALLAILKAGAVCVPLDPAYPAERIRFILEDTQAPILVSSSVLAAEQSFPGKCVLMDSDRESISRENEKNPGIMINADDAAYIIYTSGSTGVPKGVVITHHAIANHSVDCQKTYGLSSKDRVLQFSSFHFDASFEQILPALISGSSLIVRDREIWNTKEFAAKLHQFDLTVADIPTAYWHELCDEYSSNPEEVPANSLRLVVVGGEALSADKLGLWQKTPLSRARLINAYGPTETTITATSFEVPKSGAEDGPLAVFPIGKPRGDRTAYILDKQGRPVPIGVPGELHIGGSFLARGYHKRAELTAARFIPNPFSDDPNARIYKTGDLVRYLEDGNIEFLGRIDDQVKIRGYRIELGEILSHLQKHPSIREAIVLAGEGSTGNKRLLAYYTSNDSVSGNELRKFLKSRLPEFMIPACFIGLESWPLLPNGKLNRQALPDPQSEEESGSSVVAGPRDSLELQLQLIFERVLKRAPIGIDVSFFELGGDSLQALELLVEIERATGKNLPLGTLYQSSTVEAMAREIQQRGGSEQWSSLVPLQPVGTRPPLFLLHTTPGDILGYGNLVFHLSQDQPCYGFQALGLKEAHLSHEKVEDMAGYYVSLLQEFQPKGPYYLGGWCYGGILALEMARILEQKGEQIGLLALLETVALAPFITNWRYYAHRVRCLLKMGPARFLVYSREKARYARESKMANRMRFRQSESLINADLNQVDPRLAKLEHLYNTNLKALDIYKTRYYNGRITLFNASEKDPAVIPDPYYGWVGLAREIEIHEVPGNHDTMLTEPNVRSLSKKLDDCLVKAQQEKAKPQ